jgi:hypothetical protein
LRLLKAIFVLALGAPLYAQYGGPAVLTRGQAPAAMSAGQIDFRPFLTLSAGYDDGLNGVGVDPHGNPVNQSSYALEASGGVSGLHSWRHTQLGLNYRASIRHYPGRSFYDGSDQSIMLGLTHQFTRHIMFSLNNNAGIFSQSFNTPTLPQTVPFDPSTTYVPTNDFFDNRTVYLSSQANLIIQRSTRLSFAIGADGFLSRRRSTALYGTKGEGAHGDLQYRISRRTTIGFGYNYTHYSFTHIFSGTDLHSFVGSYAIRLSRSVEFSATAGGVRYETKFLQSVPIDPAIAIFICVPGKPCSVNQAYDAKNWTPSLAGRLSYVMRRGIVYVNGGHTITPGNGLFLTSKSTSAGGGYSYTALRKWTANLAASYNISSSMGNFIGSYGDYTATGSLSRQIARYTHGVLSFSARRYRSSDFTNYNKWSYGVRLGLGFTPGDVPIRLW